MCNISSTYSKKQDKLEGCDGMEYNDYELVYLSQEKNEDAYKILLNKYMPIIISKLKPYMIRSKVPYEDLLIEALVGFQNAIDSFKNQEKATFYTFLLICVERELEKKCGRITQKKINEPEEVLLSQKSQIQKELLEHIKSSEKTPEEKIITEFEVNQILEHILEVLSSYEVEVLSLRIEGLTYSEISIALDKTNKSVDGAIQRIKEKTLKIGNMCY